MLLRQFLLTGCTCAVLAAFPAFAAIQPHCCTPGRPTAASYKWNFQKEADGLFHKIQREAFDATNAAGRLQAFNRDQNIAWQLQGEKLDQLKVDINRMGNQVCRLEIIRSTLAPWQRVTVNRMGVELRLLADNDRDAILYVNRNQRGFWLPTYRMYVQNIYKETNGLLHSSGTAVEYANARHEVRQLRTAIKQS